MAQTISVEGHRRTSHVLGDGGGRADTDVVDVASPTVSSDTGNAANGAEHAERPRLQVPTGVYPSLVKPTLDRFGAGLCLLVVLPVLLACAVAVRLSLGRGIIFRQQRIGLGGRVFTLYKLRTMRPDRRVVARPFGADDRRINHKDPADPRLTGLGRFLRRWSLDELPQLWNVVRGSMSLVGPRPEIVPIVERYEPWQHRRHAVKPGLTGLWQVRARGTLPMHECVLLDIEYIDRLSAGLDVMILLRTPLALMGSCKGH